MMRFILSLGIVFGLKTFVSIMITSGLLRAIENKILVKTFRLQEVIKVMPELPEVETIRKQINDFNNYKIISEKRSQYIKSILHTDSIILKDLVLKRWSRHGKILLAELSQELTLVSQLGMSGTWRISDKPLTLKHNHLELCLKSHTKKIYLSYIDPRRFGHMYIFNKIELDSFMDKQGIDPSNKKFTLEYLKKIIKRYPQRQIKGALLDQKHFSGIGNYMANEICALAFIRPTRRNKSLTQKDIFHLFDSTLKVVNGSIKAGGVTFQGGYQDAFGEKGEGVNNLVVFYQKICRLCNKTQVKKIYIQNRGTYYCPSCQK